MKRPYGMAQRAFYAWTLACYHAKISPDRIMQTIGNAPASAGTHAKDGQDEFGFDYCAAFDIRVKDLTHPQLMALLSCCADGLIIGWHRDWPGNEHAHLIFVGLPMKFSLRAQVHDYCNDRDGLKDHARNNEFMATDGQLSKIRPAFLAHNPPRD